VYCKSAPDTALGEVFLADWTPDTRHTLRHPGNRTGKAEFRVYKCICPDPIFRAIEKVTLQAHSGTLLDRARENVEGLE